MKQFIKNTFFFFRESRTYMRGMKPSILSWAKAYIKFMKLSGEK